jgi:RNA polymerase sigma factor (sigma-70 family)
VSWSSLRNSLGARECNAEGNGGVLPCEMTATLDQLPIRLAADRDGAFPDLVRHLQDGVYSGVLQFTRNRHDAEDVTQETFVRVYRALGSYDTARIRNLRLRAWVWTIALNLCRNRARTVARRPEAPLVGDRADEFEDAAVRALDNASLEEWRQRLATLPGPQRTAVVLHHVVGLPHAEIAMSTGRSESTTRSDVRRGLARLRTMIEQEAR